MSGIVHDRVRPGPANPRGAFVAAVKENRVLCTEHFRLILSLEHFPRSIPGQFVQIDCRDPAAPSADTPDAPRTFEWGAGSPLAASPMDADFNAPLAYLRRPFSIADHRLLSDGTSEIDIIHRVIGKGTHFLGQLQPGESISLLGPLGRGFDIPQELRLACLVGGGVGIPPMLYLAKLLRERAINQAVAFVGAQRHDLLPVAFRDAATSSAGDPLMNVEEFACHGYPAIISTDDGSRGTKGFVTHALDRFLNQRQSTIGLAGTIVYCCGPTPMMKATAQVAADHGIPCQVSLEQPMACGMATCQSCVIKHRPHDAPATADWKYKLTCTEGPVFDPRDILW